MTLNSRLCNNTLCQTTSTYSHLFENRNLAFQARLRERHSGVESFSACDTRWYINHGRRARELKLQFVTCWKGNGSAPLPSPSCHGNFTDLLAWLVSACACPKALCSTFTMQNTGIRRFEGRVVDTLGTFSRAICYRMASEYWASQVFS